MSSYSAARSPRPGSRRAMALLGAGVLAAACVTVLPAGPARAADGAPALSITTNDQPGDLETFDTGTDTVFGTLVTGAPGTDQSVDGVAVSPDGATTYVADETAGTVSVIDDSTHTITATLAAGSGSWGLAVSPDGTTLYAADAVGGTVSVIDLATGAITASVPAGSGPAQSLALSPDGATLYVADARQTAKVTGAGLTWTLVARANRKETGTAEIWQAQATGALTGARVTSTLATGGYDQSLTVLAYTGAAGTGASAAAGRNTGAPAATLTTTAPGSLVFAAGEDFSHATTPVPAAAQNLVSQYADPVAGESFWVQSRASAIPAAGTALTLGDTAPATDVWNLAAVEILSAG